MNDKLRIFIQNNRPAFDTAEPPPGLWDDIERSLDRLGSARGAERFVLLNRPLLDTAEPPTALWSTLEKNLGNASDPLECFIREQRDAIDIETPDLRVWAGIEKALQPQTNAMKVGWSRYLLRAAAAVALLVVGIGLGLWYAGARQTEIAGMTLSQVSGEYAELENFYQRDIAAKQQRLVSYSGSNGVEVQEDLQQLDLIMAELQQELAHVPPGNREQVVRAMIENYKAKAAILERVLERVQDPQQLPKTKINSNKNDEIESI